MTARALLTIMCATLAQPVFAHGSGVRDGACFQTRDEIVRICVPVQYELISLYFDGGSMSATFEEYDRAIGMSLYMFANQITDTLPTSPEAAFPGSEIAQNVGHGLRLDSWALTVCDGVSIFEATHRSDEDRIHLLEFIGQGETLFIYWSDFLPDAEVDMRYLSNACTVPRLTDFSPVPPDLTE